MRCCNGGPVNLMGGMQSFLRSQILGKIKNIGQYTFNTAIFPADRVMAVPAAAAAARARPAKGGA